MSSPYIADAIDARLMRALAADRRATTVALAERIGVSRNTVQARLVRWDETKVLTSFERTISARFLGISVACLRVDQRQTTFAQRRGRRAGPSARSRRSTRAQRRGRPVDSGSGARCRRFVSCGGTLILGIKGVERTNTALVMRDLVDYRLTPLIDRLIDGTARRS